MSMRRLLALTIGSLTAPAGYAATTEYAGADGKWVTTTTVKATRRK